MSPSIAVFFDLDDVLIRTEWETFQFYQTYLKEHHGIEIPDEVFGKKTGRKSVDFFKDVLTEEERKEVDVEKLIALKRELFNTQIDRFVKRVPEGEAVVKALAEKGIPLALVTQNEKRMAETALTWLGLRPLFRAVVTIQDITEKKPAPESFLLAAEKLGISPSSCIAIEDSADGITAAKRAGCYCIALDHPHTPRYALAAADAIVRELKEIPAIVERFQKEKADGEGRP